MHPLLKPHNLFYSNDVAILSGFDDIPQNLLAQLGTLENMYVQYDCNRPSTFWDLLRQIKCASKRLNRS